MENGKNGYLKWLVGSVGLLVGIGIWVGTLQSTVAQQQREIEDFKKEVKQINEKLGQIQVSMAVIAERISK